MNIVPAEQSQPKLVPGIAPLSSGSETADYQVRLEFFSGPMDLLLHLVKQREVEIEEVEMAGIAEQYLQIISQAVYLDLDKATEYLVIAATLIAIKSQRILPIEQDGSELEGLEGELGEGDFLEELRERLKQYELTKRRAITLRGMPFQGLQTFTREDKQALLPSAEEMGDGESASRLGAFFLSLMKRIGETAQSLRIKLEPVSVVNLMMRSIDLLRSDGLADTSSQKPKTFITLVRSLLSGEKSPSKDVLELKGGQRRGMIIGSFIAVLELMRRGVLNAVPRDGSRAIDIKLTIGETDTVDNLSSEFDEEPASGDLGIESYPVQPADDSVIHLADYRKEQDISRAPVLTDKKEVNRG